MSNFLYFTKRGLSIYFYIIKLLCLYLGSPSFGGGLISGGTYYRLVFSGDLLSSSLFSSIVSILTFSTDLFSFCLSAELISSSEIFNLLADLPLWGFLLILKLFLTGEISDFYFWTFNAVSVWKLSLSFLGKPVQYFSISYLIWGSVLVTWMPYPWFSLVALSIHKLYPL